jgi:transcriptional regulator with XRE-family HTH domain
VPAKKSKTSEIDSPSSDTSFALPDVGEVLRRLRLQRGLSIGQVAESCDLSQSFLSMVERGDSDISLKRLAKLAAFFQHDIGSLLGYGSRLSKPRFVTKYERTPVDRGVGVEYEVVRLPGLELELNLMKFEPMRSFREAISHEGFDVVLVSKGEIVLCVGEDEYRMKEGDCAYYSAAYRHRLVNKSQRAAYVIGITTGRMA